MRVWLSQLDLMVANSISAKTSMICRMALPEMVRVSKSWSTATSSPWASSISLIVELASSVRPNLLMYATMMPCDVPSLMRASTRFSSGRSIEPPDTSRSVNGNPSSDRSPSVISGWRSIQSLIFSICCGTLRPSSPWVSLTRTYAS